MKKNNFIISTIILIIGGFITKILSMIIKIIMTRLVGVEGIGLYMLVNPTFVLLICLCTLGLPTALTKLVAEGKNNRKLLLSASFIIIIIDILLILFMLLFSDVIANKLLHNNSAYYPLICISLVLPFISISSILRGYFFGKQRILPHTISNIAEDITRLIGIVLITPFFLNKGIEIAVSFLILSNIISELTSILILFFFLPKKFKLTKNELKPSKDSIKDILSLSIPSTSSRLIGCIGLFLEPIILTHFLTNAGYSNEYIVYEYGILNGYVMPIILLPSFFTNAISQVLLPIVSKNYNKGNKNYIKLKIKQALFFSLLIGISATIIFIINPNIPLKLIYKTTVGGNYIRILAPICLLHYIQSPLTSVLQGINQAKKAMNGTFIGMVLKTITLIICCYLKLGIYSLIIATSINIIYVTIHHIIVTLKYLK